MKETVPPFKAVLAGCGGIANAWLDAIKEFSDVKIVGMMDIRAEAARETGGDELYPVSADPCERWNLLTSPKTQCCFK